MRAISSCVRPSQPFWQPPLTKDVNSWLILKIIYMIRHRKMQHSSVIATGVVTSTLICVSVISAFPWIRK